jgi:hypothetical protein
MAHRQTDHYESLQVNMDSIHSTANAYIIFVLCYTLPRDSSAVIAITTANSDINLVYC